MAESDTLIVTIPSSSSSSPPSIPSRFRWSVDNSLFLYNYISDLLSKEENVNINEATFLMDIKTKLLEQKIPIDDAKLQQRFYSMEKAANAVEQQEELVGVSRENWKTQRQQFQSEQQQSKQQRRNRVSRLRTPSQTIIDSDSEFDIPEPKMDAEPVNRAAVTAYKLYAPFKQRFIVERQSKQEAEKKQKNEERNQQRRLQRRNEILSSVFPSSHDSSDSSPVSSSESSASSSSSPSKRNKFQSAAVIQVYTSYMLQQTQKTAELANELKDSISRAEAATKQYREKKLEQREKRATADRTIQGKEVATVGER